MFEKPRHIVSSQSALTPNVVKAFSQREDVRQALPYFSPWRKLHLTTIDIQSRNGETHNYLVLKQGRKRFLFDSEQPQMPSSDASNEQRKKSLSFTLVVPQQVMQEEGFISQEGNVFSRFQSRSDVRRFFKTMEREGYFVMRGNPQDQTSIENNTDVIQPIPAVVVQDTQDRLLFSIRGTNTNHDDRLAGMISMPFTMGHSEPGDFGIWRRFLRYGLKLSMYREAAEETAFQKNGETFHVFPSTNGHDYHVTVRGLLRFHHYYRLQPLGVVFGGEETIGQVHAGIIFTAHQKRKSVSLVPNGSSHEKSQIISLSPEQYQQAIQDKTFTPTPWNEAILKEISTASPSRRRRFTNK